jgi:cysteinyl-tRNA synthetase
MTTHPEHDEEREALRKKLAVTKTFNYDVYCGQDIANNCIPFEEALDEIADFILAHTTKAVEEAESRLTAKMQSEIVSPAIDDDFGTYDYKMVAENALNFIEKRLSTPTLKGRQPHDQQSKVREILEFVWSLSPHNKNRMAEAEQTLYDAIRSEVIGKPGKGHIPDEECCDQCDLIQKQLKALDALFGKKGKTE